MRFLSEKNKVYLLLTEAVITFFTLILAVFFANIVEPDFLQKNVYYQVLTSLIVSFVYLNASTINKELRIAAFLKILKMIIRIVIILVLPNIMPVIIFDFFLTDLLGFADAILDVVFVIYFYKGLSNLVSVKTKNTALVKKWDKLLVANVIITIYNLISYINGLYGNSIFSIENTAFAILFSLIVSVYMIVLGVLKIVYIIKTGNELGRKTGDG